MIETFVTFTVTTEFFLPNLLLIIVRRSANGNHFVGLVLTIKMALLRDTLVLLQPRLALC